MAIVSDDLAGQYNRPRSMWLKLVLGYLKSARLEHGLLINFGSYKFEMRKVAWSQNGTCRKSKPTFL